MVSVVEPRYSAPTVGQAKFLSLSQMYGAGGHGGHVPPLLSGLKFCRAREKNSVGLEKKNRRKKEEKKREEKKRRKLK